MIKYVAFYNLPQFNNEGRTTNLAGISVMDYMKDVYANCDSVDIYSPSHTVLRSGKFSAKKIAISEKVNFYMPKTRGAKTFIGRIVRNIYTELWLIGKLLFKTRKGDTVICYHSPYVMTAVKIAKRLKRFKLLLEIREIYGDVYHDARLKRKENKFFRLADKYIFATEDLNEIVNKNKKPYVISPGNYNLKQRYDGKFDDGKVHLVYAGNMSKDYGGAYNAVDLVKALSDKYVLHVLSSGSEQEKREFLDYVERTNSVGKVIFEGTKYGEEFNAFLQKCDMGLSTRSINKSFNETSFPSKVLTYLTNGICVLSPRISCVKKSPVRDMVVFYDNEEWKQVAKQIESGRCCIDSDKVRAEISLLDKKLREDCAELLKQEKIDL